MRQQQTALDLYRLLEQRHARDLFWNEVKNGPTWGGSHMRLDALAIPKSWSPVRVFGYELKVSRSDWVRDQKFQDYAGLCNYLSVVAVEGIVEPSEVPEGIGLLVPAKTGTMLRTIRKPVRRDAAPHWPTLLYLLMSRTKPDNDVHHMSREARIAQWKAELDSDKDARSIGRKLRGKIAQRMENLERASKRGQDLDQLDAWLDQHDPEGRWGYSVGERLERVRLAGHRETLKARDALNKAAIRAARLLRCP